MKINNGKELTRKDKKIWNTVTRGIKPEQAKAAVAAALAIPFNSDTTTTGTDTAAIKHKPLLHVNTPNTTSTTTSSSPYPTKTGTNSPNKTKPSRRQSMGGSADRKAGLGLRSSFRSSGGAIASGLNALSTSMKKRLGLTVITTNSTTIDGEDHETSDNTEGSPNKNTMKNKTFSKTPTTTTPTEFINPRGTNISITPKPRSYLPQSKPKNIASPKPDKTKENHHNFPTQDSINNTTTTTTTSIVNTTDNEKFSSGKSGKISGTNTEGTSGKPGITSMLTAGLSAFSTSFKETFSFKRSVSSIKGSRNTTTTGTATAGAGAMYNIDIGEENEEKLHGGDDDFNSSTPTPTATMTAKPSSSSIIVATGTTGGSAVSPGKSPNGVHFTATGQQSHSGPHSTPPSPAGKGQQGHSGPHSTPPSPAGKGRLLPTSSPKINNSNSNNSNHNISSSNSNIELTPEQYRDRILQQQSLQTASSLQAVKEHIQEYDEEYHFNKDIGSKKRSPIEDFFNSMSPFGRSASVLPSSPSHNRVLPSD